VVVAAGYETKVLGELEKEPEPGSLELKVFPAGALVFIDGKPITLPMGGVVEVLEGEHVLSIAMEGFVPVEQRFTIAAHKLFRHRVELRERETGQDPYLKGFPGGEPVVAKRPTNPYKVGGWTAIGVGAASFVTGGVVHGLAFLDAQDAEGIPNLPGRRDEFERKRDDAKTKEITAYALYGVGAALVTTGLVLLLVDPNDSNDDSDDSDDTQVVPTAMGRGGAGLFVTGRF